MVKVDPKTKNISLNSGKHLKFSETGLAEVISDQSRCCFCGSKFQEAGRFKRTKEHIIPEWVISHCGLEDSWSVLPNKQQKRYTSLTIFCCDDCNKAFDNLFEKPLSKVFKKGSESVRNLISTDQGANLLFAWVAFVTAKKRLFTSEHSFNPDPREISPKFEDAEGLKCLSWMLTLAQAQRYKTEARFVRRMYVIPVVNKYSEPAEFDFKIDPLANTALVSIGDSAVICCFSHGCPTVISDKTFWGIPQKGHLTRLQVSEIYSEVCSQALSFEQKHYQVGEYDDKLSVSYGDTYSNRSDIFSKRRFNLPANYTQQHLLDQAGEQISNEVRSTDYWHFVVKNLQAGKGSFFPNRGKTPYFDPSNFDDGVVLTETEFTHRTEQLTLFKRNLDPLLLEELQQNWGI